MTRRQYTPQFKARAVALADKVGAAAAAKRLRINDSRIHAWRRGAGVNHTPTGDAHVAQLDQAIAFILGETRARLAGYAEGLGVPAAVLAARVGRLLQHSARGPLLGLEHRLPAVRGSAAE